MILKPYIFISLLLGVWMLLPSRSYSVSLPGIYLVWIGIWFMLVRTLWASDDSVRCEAVINSLPLSKRDIVCSRHLASTVFLVHALIVMVAWFLIMRNIGVQSMVPIPWFLVISIGIVLSALITIVSFPIFFKLDHMKARWASLFIFILIFVILNNTLGQTSGTQGSQVIQWIEALSIIPSLQLIGISVLIFVALTWLSIEISTLVYRTREF